jgi:hypothetical protein
MLGIGADAVRKTKSRLRQRLQLAPEKAGYASAFSLLPKQNWKILSKPSGSPTLPDGYWISIH